MNPRTALVELPGEVHDNAPVHTLLAAALDEAEPLIAERGWIRPSDATLAEAARLLEWVAARRAPSVHVEPDGTVQFEWEAADSGWITLAVNGQGHLTHNAVIGEDEFGLTEEFGNAMPEWAAKLLARVLRAGH